MGSKLIIQKSRVIKLFEALGFKKAKNWKPGVMKKNLARLPELVDGVKIRNPKTRAILKQLTEASSIVFLGEGEKDASSTPKKSEKREVKNSPRKKTKKSTKKKDVTPKTKTESKGIDKLGCRNGSQAALINSFLTTGGQTAKELADRSGFAVPRVTQHLYYLLSSSYKEKIGKTPITKTTDKDGTVSFALKSVKRKKKK